MASSVVEQRVGKKLDGYLEIGFCHVEKGCEK